MKITIIGAGNVGANTAKCIAEQELASQVVLLDIVEGVPQGKALDMAQSLAIIGNDTHVIGTNNYSDTVDSDIVIITAGVARKPGMTRDDLFNINAKIVGDCAENCVQVSPNAIYIVVTNPLDAITHLVWKRTKLPKNRVFGMAGDLDNARFRYFLAKEAGVAVSDVSTLVLGSHGDSMVPIISATTISGMPVRAMIDPQRLESIVARVRDGGGEIVRLLKNGSAFYAPAEATARMVSAITKNKNLTVNCSALCEGEYGINGVFIGVPVRLIRSGISKIMEFPLEKVELDALRHSAAVANENLTALGLYN
jgi:malate dehydrogenase